MSKKGQNNWVGYQPPYNSLKDPRAGFDSIYKSGRNNLYPYHLKFSVQGSPTGAMAHRMHTDNIASLDYKNRTINKSRDILLSSVVRNAAIDLSLFQFYAIHVNYKWDGENFIPVNPTILPAEDVRLNKEDDHGNFSKIFVSDWREAKKRNEEIDWYYKYNPETSVIFSQIRKDAEDAEIDLDTDEGISEALRNYRGQVRILNYTGEFPYPVAMADSVLPDMLSEYYVSMYTQGQSFTGFLGKTVAFVVDGTSDEDEDAEDEMFDWMGAEGSAGVFVKKVTNVDDIDKVMKIVNFPSSFDDKMFEVTEKRLRRNILQCFDNLPEILVYSGDGAMFGTNPETWENAEAYYFKRTRYLRDYLKETLEDTLKITL